MARFYPTLLRCSLSTFFRSCLCNRAGPLGGAKPTILPGVGVALAARGSCSYRGWCIYFFLKIFYKKVTGAYVWRYYSYTKIKVKTTIVLATGAAHGFGHYARYKGQFSPTKTSIRSAAEPLASARVGVANYRNGRGLRSRNPRLHRAVLSHLNIIFPF